MENINSEFDFENHLRNDIIQPIINELTEFRLFDFKKAVDILISKNGENPKLFFIEVKYHKLNHGRLGYGQGQGGGFQPEVLMNRIDYFENNLIWILGHESHEGYWLVDNDTIRNYSNGGAVGAKYNGIQLSFFSDIESLSREELIHQIKNWLS